MDTNYFNVNIKEIGNSYIALRFYSEYELKLTIISCNFIREYNEESLACDRVIRVQRVRLKNNSARCILSFPSEADNHGTHVAQVRYKHVNVIVRDDTNKEQFSVSVPFSSIDVEALDKREMAYGS